MGAKGLLSGTVALGLCLTTVTRQVNRAMLCMRCNAAVGQVQEDVGIARALADYVDRCAQFRQM